MVETIVWWILVELIGLAVWPIAFRFFRNLPDRGYAFSKALGLLLVTWPFWLLTSFGILDNSQGAIALVVMLLGILSWMVLGAAVQERANEPRGSLPADGAPPSSFEISVPNGHTVARPSARAGGTHTPVSWMLEHRALLLTTEVVFTTGFFFWVTIRAFMPEISATEKPMEFAFLNGILQSAHFPPLDPWLSGYAISYYYFGYVIVAMLTQLSGIPSNITFNLAIGLLFALAGTGAFGLAFNLIHAQFPSAFRSATRSALYAVLAPVYLLIMGNLEAVFEVLHNRGLGSSEFWQWLDINGLAQAPTNGTWVPSDTWWWWRASRVIHDVVGGKTQEVIDEFPQFSFLLGDMHPHVLALPFAFLALATAFNLLRERDVSFGRIVSPGAWEANKGLVDIVSRFLLTALIVGALPFLNFWDVLPYGFIIAAAMAIARYRTPNRWQNGATKDLIVFVVGVVLVGGLLYLPFYAGFQSQAGGLLPVLFVKTRLHQYLIMFGVFIFLIVSLLIRMSLENRSLSLSDWAPKATPFVAALISFPLVVAALAVVLVTVNPAIRESARAAFPDSPDNPLSNVISAYLQPLAADPWLTVLLVVLLTAALVLLRLRVIDLAVPDTSKTFILLLVFTGLLLTYGVEFVYLRDVFATRMNTVFKFYFQTWTLCAVAAAWIVCYMTEKLGGIVRAGWVSIVVVLSLTGLIYPVLAIPNRADGFAREPSLDGTAYIQQISPSDYAGIQWLKQNAPRGSLIVEATGRQYTYDDRMSMATGLPTVLGWIGHEDQWRGGSKLYKDDVTGIDRAADVARLYQTTNPQEALTYIDKYAISFVVVGQTERSVYSLNRAQIDKFSTVLTMVFENGDLRIYARSR